MRAVPILFMAEEGLIEVPGLYPVVGLIGAVAMVTKFLIFQSNLKRLLTISFSRKKF